MTAPTRHGARDAVASARLSPRELRLEEPSGATAPAEARRSTGEDLLEFPATWEGDDLEECLAVVASSRSEARF